MSDEKALVIVDVQNDFCPGGALPVKEGDTIVPVINRYIEVFRAGQHPVLFSRDWHPPETKHFKKYGGPWPEHCVRDTPGAAFHPGLNVPENGIILSKGTDKEADGYTAFQAVDPMGKRFPDILRFFEVDTLFVAGLATDYCVKATVLDALGQGYKVVLLEDAIKGVDLNPGDSQKALDEMGRAGARTADSSKIERMLNS